MKTINFLLVLNLLTVFGCNTSVSPKLYQVETEDYVKYRVAYIMTCNTLHSQAIEDTTEIEKWIEDENIPLDAFNDKVERYYDSIGDIVLERMDKFDDYVFQQYSLTNEREGFHFVLQQTSHYHNKKLSELAQKILRNYEAITVDISYKENESHDGTTSWKFEELKTGSTGVVSISSDNEWSCKMTSFGKTLTNYSNFQ